MQGLNWPNDIIQDRLLMGILVAQLRTNGLNQKKKRS
jgi:hypothetical protein